MEKFRFKDRKEYQKALDSVIMVKNIQSRDIGNGKTHRYLPIAIKDAIADYIFNYWNVIEEKYRILNGMLVCNIKMVFMPDYPEAVDLFCTGSAAVFIQSAKNALEYQLPAVRSEAIGNAFGSLGNIFGRNLSRKLNKTTAISDDFTIRKEKVTKKETDKATKEVTETIESPF